VRFLALLVAVGGCTQTAQDYGRDLGDFLAIERDVANEA